LGYGLLPKVADLLVCVRCVLTHAPLVAYVTSCALGS
jgi:hypothetical protein